MEIADEPMTELLKDKYLIIIIIFYIFMDPLHLVGYFY
jgi:hypothetical protein